MTDRDLSDGQSMTQTYEISASESPSHAVVRAVSTHTGTDLLDLPPLHDAINSDTLDDAFESDADSSSIELSFTYSGCRITLTGTWIHVYELDAENGEASG